MTDSSDDNQQSARKRRVQFDAFSEAEMFLHKGRRFSCRISGATNNSAASENVVPDHEILNQGTDRRSSAERRSSSDRRSGIDTRSDAERFLQGERRSRVDRRSNMDRRHRTFKKARAFVRSLKLKSESEWLDYTKSGMKPDDIPVDPHNVYANDGWAGWGDWLGATAFGAYLSQYRSTARAFSQRLRLRSESKSIVDSKLAEKPDVLPARSQETCVAADGEAEMDVKPKAPAEMTVGDNIIPKRLKSRRKNSKAKSKPR